jgi:hypothetical protein
MSLKKSGADVVKIVLAHVATNGWTYLQLIGALAHKDYSTAFFLLKKLCVSTAFQLFSKYMKSLKEKSDDDSRK